MNTVQFALDNLANNLRIYAENRLRAEGLFAVDPEEAINNIDRSFESMLEAFHRVYDVTKEEFNFFEYADTSLLILLRNAIHHRDHPLFKSWNYEMHLNGGMNQYSGAEFIFVNYKTIEDGIWSEYYFKLSDIFDRIDKERGSAYIEKKMSDDNKAKLVDLIRSQLKTDIIQAHAEEQRYPFCQVYLNMIQILSSGVSRVFHHFRDSGVLVKGYDATVYAEHFTTAHIINLNSSIEYKALRIP
ncbi:MAG: hypothetical protein WCK60_03130 [Candidatus Nomurabacteria bacterium]